MSDKQVIYIDGEFVDKADAKVSVFDHGLLYGDGLFEGIRAYNGRVFKLKEHIDRMYNAARAISLDIPLTKAEMTEVVLESCRRNAIVDGYVRLVVTRGYGDLGLSPKKCTKPTVISIAAQISLYPLHFYEDGLKVIISTVRRNKATILDPQVKTLNYMNNILARIEADRVGAPEALMLTEDGLVAECTGDNIFIVINGEIWTPPIHMGILDGITRGTVIDLAREKGYTVREKEFTVYNILCADECFLTGTAAELIAVTELDGKVIGSGRAGDYSGTVGDYSGTVGDYSGTVGDYSGTVGDYSGTVGDYSGTVGDYSGKAGEVTRELLDAFQTYARSNGEAI